MRDKIVPPRQNGEELWLPALTDRSQPLIHSSPSPTPQLASPPEFSEFFANIWQICIFWASKKAPRALGGLLSYLNYLLNLLYKAEVNWIHSVLRKKQISHHLSHFGGLTEPWSDQYIKGSFSPSRYKFSCVVGAYLWTWLASNWLQNAASSWINNSQSIN